MVAALASLGVLRPLGAAIYASLVMLQTVGDEIVGVAGTSFLF